MADDDDPTALSSQGAKLHKCPEKAMLFETICNLFKPLTEIAYSCPMLLSHLKKAGNWRDMQLLCASYIQQDPSKPKYVVPAQGVPVGQDPNSNLPTRSASQVLPEAPCSSQPVIVGWRPLAQLQFRSLFWQKARPKRQVNLPLAVIKLLSFPLVIQKTLLVINLVSPCLVMLLGFREK